MRFTVVSISTSVVEVFAAFISTTLLSKLDTRKGDLGDAIQEKPFVTHENVGPNWPIRSWLAA